MQKNKKYTDEFIKEVMNFKNKNSYFVTPIEIIITWVHKQRDVKACSKQEIKNKKILKSN